MPLPSSSKPSDKSNAPAARTPTHWFRWFLRFLLWTVGLVVAAGVGLVLTIAVALAVAEDDKASISAWLAAGQVNVLNPVQAEDLLARDPALWAVVVAPWVLVQERATPVELH